MSHDVVLVRGNAPMSGARRLLRLAVLLCAVAAPCGAAKAAPSIAATAASPQSTPIVVEVQGDVPGFTHAQLLAFLARKTEEAAGAPWRFAVGQDGATAPNRIVWSFKTLRTLWKGGSHSGFPSPSYSETYLHAEVKFYLADAYQMTMIAQSSVYGGDKALSKMVQTVSHAMFVENKP